jgi:hypothetical protein
MPLRFEETPRGPISTTAPGDSAAAEPGTGSSAGSATDGHESALRSTSSDGAPEMLDALRVTAANIRSLGPAGALDAVPEPYRVWLGVVDAAIAKAEGRA